VSQAGPFFRIDVIGDRVEVALVTYPEAWVSEPNWLFRLLGDSTEQRIERAKARLLSDYEKRRVKHARLKYFQTSVPACPPRSPRPPSHSDPRTIERIG
jgi:hypothetical protein